MARAKDQQRWRENSAKKRVEVYLRADSVERLDRLARERGESRAAVIGSLIEKSTSESPAAPVAASVPVHRVHKPTDAFHKRYNWIVSIDGVPVFGLLKRPDGWIGSKLGSSVYAVACKRSKRNSLIDALLQMTELYR